MNNSDSRDEVRKTGEDAEQIHSEFRFYRQAGLALSATLLTLWEHSGSRLAC